MSCIDKIVNDPVMVPADLCRQGQPLFLPIFILTPYISEASRTLNKPLKMEGGLKKGKQYTQTAVNWKRAGRREIWLVNRNLLG